MSWSKQLQYNVMIRMDTSIVNCHFSVDIACEVVVIVKGGGNLLLEYSAMILSFIWRRSQYQRKSAYNVLVGSIRSLLKEESLSCQTFIDTDGTLLLHFYLKYRLIFA